MNSETLERRLEQLWQVDLPDALVTSLDTRMEGLLSGPAVVERPSRGGSLHLGRSLAAAVMATVLLAAAAYGFGVFDRLIGQNPGWQQAWSQATDLNLPVSIGSHELVVAKAYADANQVLVGVTSSDLRDVLARAGEISLSDATGRTYQQSSGVTAPQGDGGSIGLLNFVSTENLAPGAHRFTLAGAGAHPWHVTFTLAVQSTSVAPGTRLTTDQFRFTLQDATISPSTVRVALDVALQPDGDASRAWAPIAHLVHGGKTIAISVGTWPDNGIGTHILFSESGATDASGDWKLVITEMVGVAGDGSQIRIPIDKPLEFWVP